MQLCLGPTLAVVLLLSAAAALAQGSGGGDGGGGGGGFQRNAGQSTVDAYFAGGTGGICPEPPALCPWAGRSAGGAAGGVPGSPDPDAWAAAMGGGAGWSACSPWRRNSRVGVAPNDRRRL